MAELDLGTLEVKLQANIDQLRADFLAAQKETKRTADEASKLTKAFNKAFDGTATAMTRMAGNFNQIGESITKVFGETGLASAKKFAGSLGVMPDQIETISVALKGLGGAFSAVAVAAGAMSAPLAAALAMVVGLVGAYGALKKTGVLKDAAAEFRFQKASLTGDQQELERLAIEKEPEWGFLSKTMEETGLGPTASPESTAGSSLKSDIGSALKESFGEAWKDIEPLIDQVKSVFAPDTTKKDAEAAKKASDDAARAEKERQKALQDAFNEQAKIYDEEIKAREEEAKALKKAMEDEQKAREKAADDIAKAIEAANSSYEQYQRSLDETIGGVGGSRMGGASGPARSANGGPTMSEAALDERTALDKDIESGVKGLGQAALQGSGTFGEVIAAFQQSGSLIGGIINALLKLFEKSEGFKTILSMLGDVMQMLADGLGQIFDGLQPVIGVLGEIVTWIIGILQPILSKVSKVLEPIAAILQIVFVALDGLAPLLTFFAQAIGGVLQAVGWILQKVIFPVVQGVLFVVMKIGQALSWALNGIIDALSAVMWEIGALLQKVGAQDAGTAMKSAADAMHQYEIDTKAINDAANAMWDSSYSDALAGANATLVPLDDLGDSAGDAAASIREFSESITNVPSGYKVALARFNAAAPENSSVALAAGGASTTNNSFAVTIKTDDPASLWAELKKMMERDSVIESGSPVPGAPEFLAA